MSRPATPRTKAPGLAAMSLIAAVVSNARPAIAADLLSGLGGPAGFGSNRMDTGSRTSTCDIGSAGPIDMSLAFPPGVSDLVTIPTLCVNANGTCSLDGPVDEPTPTSFPRSDSPLIAAWWADVDTRGGSASDPDHDAIYWDVRLGQVTVTWHNVGYFARHDELQNDFQLIVRSIPGCGLSAYDLEFRYHRCEWTAGDASGGVGGHCPPGTFPPFCSAALAGYDLANGTDYVMLPGSLMDSVRDLCRGSNVGVPGVWRVVLRQPGPPCNAARCDTRLPGVCAIGSSVCTATGESCQQTVWPSPEACDGLDNDCDGLVDDSPDARLCPAGMSCDGGRCRPTCVGGRCPVGQSCAATGVCVDDRCLDVLCLGGTECVDGSCVDPCADIRCPTPSICMNGRCVDRCAATICPVSQVCDDGTCQRPCPCRACETGFVCSASGVCIAAGCAGLECAPGQMCVSGPGTDAGTAHCVDPCGGAVCPHGQRCVSGRCTMDSSPLDAGVANDGSSDASRAVGDTDDVAQSSPEAVQGGCECTMVRTGQRSGLRSLATFISGLLFAHFFERRRRRKWHVRRAGNTRTPCHARRCRTGRRP